VNAFVELVACEAGRALDDPRPSPLCAAGVTGPSSSDAPVRTHGNTVESARSARVSRLLVFGDHLSLPRRAFRLSLGPLAGRGSRSNAPSGRSNHPANRFLSITELCTEVYTASHESRFSRAGMPPGRALVRMPGGYTGTVSRARLGRASWSAFRELIPSLANTLCRCHSTVRGLMNSRAPISGLERRRVQGARSAPPAV
jgi:hypothetical protein